MTFLRYPGNPILTRADVPQINTDISDVSSVFNPGAAVLPDGTVVLLLRVQTRGRRTVLLAARSRDGRAFDVRPRPIEFAGLDEAIGGEVYHVYDPRITRIEDSWHIVVAVDTDDGCRMAFARTRDFDDYEFLGLAQDDDVRNGVLFPERRDGRFLRLARPNDLQTAGGAMSGDEIVLSSSDDLRSWRREGTVMRGNPRRWDERIGSGPPPVKTREGWLHVYHGVATHFAAASLYQVGAVLLDLDDPTRVLARTRNNVLEPREPYETVGQVPNVVFPSGWVVTGIAADGFAPPEAAIRLYYGAADTVVGLATDHDRRVDQGLP